MSSSLSHSSEPLPGAAKPLSHRRSADRQRIPSAPPRQRLIITPGSLLDPAGYASAADVAAALAAERPGGRGGDPHD